MYKIKLFEKKYVEELLKLLSKEYNSKVKESCIYEKYISNNKNILIAVDVENDSLIGCAFYEIVFDEIRNNKYIYITYVVVKEKYRREGIGREMFKELESIGKNNECSSIELTSANFRKESHDFYSHIGFNIKKNNTFYKTIMICIKQTNFNLSTV